MDIRLVQDTRFPALSVTLDWLLLNDGTLDEKDALATAMMVALGTDRRALPDDILPDPDATDRRGWWGDLDAEAIWDGWPVGTRLWIMQRAKISSAGAQEGSALARIEQYAREALQPFIERKIASQLYVRAERTGVNRIDLQVILYRGPKQAIDLQFQLLWDE